MLDRLIFSAAMLALTSASVSAQAPIRGTYPGPRVGGSPYAIRPTILGGPGFTGTLRATSFQYTFGFGYGLDYSGNYYRPLSNFGYYYLGDYYADPGSLSLRTPLSPPPVAAVATPNLVAPAASSPNYTFPDLVNNPDLNPTIRRPGK